MNHSELVAQSTTKFANHNLSQCEHAIRDIHKTFGALGSDIDPEYETKLYAELDAARDRKKALLAIKTSADARSAMSRSNAAAADILLRYGQRIHRLSLISGTSIEQSDMMRQLATDIANWRLGR